MTLSEFLEECSDHCNSCDVLLSGIKKLFPDNYENVHAKYLYINSEDNSKRIAFLCQWLKEHGVQV